MLSSAGEEQWFPLPWCTYGLHSQQVKHVVSALCRTMLVVLPCFVLLFPGCLLYSTVLYFCFQDEDYNPLRVVRDQDGAPAHYAEKAKGFNIGILPQTFMDPEQVLFI